jgi:hypothetical protein
MRDKDTDSSCQCASGPTQSVACSMQRHIYIWPVDLVILFGLVAEQLQLQQRGCALSSSS